MAAAISEASSKAVRTAVTSLQRMDHVPEGPSLTKTGNEFEAMFLRQTLESILPDSKTGVFGGGTAAGMWRTMMADQMSTVLAERGVLNLASMLHPVKDVT